MQGLSTATANPPPSVEMTFWVGRVKANAFAKAKADFFPG